MTDDFFRSDIGLVDCVRCLGAGGVTGGFFRSDINLVDCVGDWRGDRGFFPVRY